MPSSSSIALAGAGLITYVHIDAINEVDGLHLAAVSSRSPERAAEAGARLGVPACTYDELPAGADSVLVATSPGHHAEVALRLLDAGVAVLVEKPLCTTLADADRLVDAVARGGRLAYAENLVHAPAVDLALSIASEFSRIDTIEVRAIQPPPTWGDFLTEGWGGGVLFDLGAHPIALALLVAAPARPVMVRAELHGSDDHPVDDYAEMIIQFDTGAFARVETSWRATDHVTWDLQASSADGVVRLELLPDVRLEHDGEPVSVGEGPTSVLQELGYLDQMASFARDVNEGRMPLVGAAFGRSVLDVTCAAYHSTGTGSDWVPLPFEGPRDRNPIDLWKRP